MFVAPTHLFIHLCYPLLLLYIFLTHPSMCVYFFFRLFVLSHLQAVRVPVYCLSRVPQMLALFTSKHVGQLSPVSFAVNFLGSVIRIFTSKNDQTNGDSLILAGFWASIVLNLAIIAQIAFYTKWPGGLGNKPTTT